MLFKSIIVILLLFISVDLKAQNNVTIYVVNKTQKPLQLYYHDLFYRGTPVHIDKLSSTEIVLDAVPTFIIIANRFQHYYKVSGPDTIIFENSGQVRTIGTDSIINTALELLYFKGIQLRQVSISEMQSPIATYTDYLRDREKVNNNARLELGKLNNISDLQKDEIRRYIDAAYFASLFEPPFHVIFSFSDSLNLYLAKIGLNLLRNLPFETTAPFYMPYMSLINKTVQNDTAFFKKMHFVNNSFSVKKTSELLKGKLIVDRMNDLSASEIQSLVAYYIEDSLIAREVISYCSKHSRIVTIDSELNTLIDSDFGIHTLDNILTRLKGSLLYIDFWASWCEPCMDEMNYYPALNKLYNNKLVFLFISFDTDTVKWRKSIRQFSSIMNNNSFLLRRDFNAPFALKNKIVTIPRYMIIGRNGNILNIDAPRPSSPKLQLLIDKYLKDGK